MSNTIQVMLDALKWFVEHDDTNIGQPGNEFFESGLNRGIAAISLGEAELKRRQDAITAVEFWISCNTDKKDAYCALLTLLKEEIK